MTICNSHPINETQKNSLYLFLSIPISDSSIEWSLVDRPSPSPNLIKDCLRESSKLDPDDFFTVYRHAPVKIQACREIRLGITTRAVRVTRHRISLSLHQQRRKTSMRTAQLPIADGGKIHCKQNWQYGKFCSLHGWRWVHCPRNGRWHEWATSVNTTRDCCVETIRRGSAQSEQGKRKKSETGCRSPARDSFTSKSA